MALPRKPPPAGAPASRRADGPSLPARYGFAAAATVAALALSFAAREWIGLNVFIFFFLAIVLAAWHGGRGPALLVAAAAIPLVSWFFVPPFRAWSLTPGDLVRFAVFAAVAFLIGSMRESLGEARRRAEESAAEAREHAELLQEQAAELEMQAAELQTQAAELEEQAVEARALAAELEEAQTRLRESMEAKLAEAQRLARLGSWEWDVATDRVTWSDEMFRVYGHEPGAFPVSFQAFIAHVHPEDRERVEATIDEAYRERKRFELDHRIVLAGGAVRILQARGEVVLDEAGEPVLMRGTGQDVTEQRAAAEAERRLAAERSARAEAEAARRRTEQILEGVGDAFVALDREWRYTYVNSRAVETLGKPREELLGRVIWEVFPLAAAGPAGDAFRRVAREGGSAQLEYFSPSLQKWLAVRAYPWEEGLAVFYEDVTERRRAEEQIARLAAIVESSEDAILAKTLDGTIVSWNRGAERLYGYTAAEAVGKNVSILAPPDRADEIPGILARLARGEHVAAYETVRMRRDGTRVDVLLSVSPLKGTDGSVTGASTIARDITARKRTENSFRFLAEAGRALSASLDLQATLDAVARLAVPRLADYLAVYLVGDDGAARVAGVAHARPELAPLVRELVERYPPAAGGPTPASRVLATGEPVLQADVAAADLPPALSGADRERLLAELAPRSYLAVPLRSEERTVGAITLVTSASGRRYDAADLALAEELARRLATAMENARLHQAEQAARRSAERAAGRIAQLQGVTAALSEARTPAEVADVVIGGGLRSLGARAGWLLQVAPEGGALELLRAHGYPPEVVESFRRVPLDAPVPLADSVREARPIFQESVAARAERYPHLHREYGGLGNRAWASVPLLVEGRAIGGIGLSFETEQAFDDETREFMLALGRQAALALERARLFEAERRARAEAEAANRAKSEFLTTMSHELRTPLNAIAGYVELLELGIRGPVTPAQLEDLERIRRSQKHLLGLINDVLNFARIETGHVHFEIADVPLDDALAELEALISPQVGSKGLEYRYRRFDPAVTVRADRDKLQQVVLNLLSNAVKFTPRGGRIDLECQAVDGAVAVRVADTGMGIPADKLATIFDPFVQVNAGYTRTSEGTGLGLAISRDLARAMGGDLVVESREGEGSVFTVTLPVGGASADGGASSGAGAVDGSGRGDGGA